MPPVNISDRSLEGLAFFLPVALRAESGKPSGLLEEHKDLFIKRQTELLSSIIVDILEDDLDVLDRFVRDCVAPVQEAAIEYGEQGLSLREAAILAHKTAKRS